MKSLLSRAGYGLNPKTNVWSRPEYPGIDYDDGEIIEQRLAEIIEHASDISVLSTELRQHCTDWPSLYHLSSTRANILRPFQSMLESTDVLEIGAGCGAITRYLGECGAHVLALEGTHRRASIARSRTRDLPNVIVVSDTFDDFKWDHQFDVITLIGVLEYANLFTPGEDPALGMLRRVRAMLKPNGKLVVAVENQLGLKYFTGAPEDHIGQAMYGLEGRYRKDQPHTYGRKVLTEMLRQAGFASSEFMAPFPDYKLPASIVSESGFVCEGFDASALAWQSVKRDPQLPPLLAFSPELVWPVLMQNGVALDLANSFLIVAGTSLQHVLDPLILAWHFTSERSKEFCKETRFLSVDNGAIEVQYYPLVSGSTMHIHGRLLTFNIPEKAEYVHGRPLSEELVQIVTRDGWCIEEVATFLKRYLQILLSMNVSAEISLPIDSPDIPIPGELFDALPQNIIVCHDGTWQVIDQEWTLNDDLSVGRMIFRSLHLLIHSVTRFGTTDDDSLDTPLELILAVFKAMGFAITDDTIERYAKQEIELQTEVARRPLNYDEFLQWLRTTPLPRQNLNQALVERDGQIANLKQAAAEREMQIASLNKAVAEHERIVGEWDQRFGNLYARLLTKEEELRRMHSSLLWRNISKVRILRERLCPEGSWRGKVCASLVHWLKGSDLPVTQSRQSPGGVLDRVLTSAKSLLPVSPHRKHQLVSFVFGRFGSFFQQTESYRRWKDMQLPVLHESGNPHFSPQNPLRQPVSLIQLEPGGMTTLIQSFHFTEVEQPLVSIVIPVYNHLEYTVCCLASILRYVPQCSFEVIIVDDGSQDETPQILPDVQNIRYCRNETNIGFLHSCNRGATLARGQYLLLLNNDTQVLEGWLDELVNTFQEQSEVGLVGSKLLYPNGVLQEAGAIIKPDGSAELVGLNGDPDRPEYNVVREVDYCSGACLLIKAELFKTLGGFDDIYAPSYCEDSDLAFRVRKLGKRVFYQPRSVVVHHLSVSTNDSRHAKMPLIAKNSRIFMERWSNELKKLHEVRAIAFFLPQYHPIPENDRWWGKGFTEWTNVTKARPNFQGHYQPHLPADLGFYDLRMPEVREEQARLARQYGISAFCYYYYWFAGKKLLNRPLDEVLQSGSPDFPFCLCWANENWTRRWDGCEEDILIAQSHTQADHAGFIAEIAPALLDPRYVRIHGKPLVIVYRLGQFPEPKRTADLWREYCVNAGIGEIYLAYVQSFDRMPMGDDPSLYGFDAAIEFPPHRYPVQAELSQPLTNPEYQGVLFDYAQTSENFIRRPWPSYKLFKGVMPSWDNTARRQDVSHVFVGANPERYEYWLRQVVEQTRRFHFGDERVVFINAWNEWAEGNHLEPDREFGHQYLVATKNGLG
ncbi:glycoside hydrolase family 99-like domain-containing protein [Candidatus Nitrospira allomarina]|uniref:Glycoside hydrolase family 99-like domain-containing protein n=1 Tax=Candidatus Nitrospira allomarina TaxID=3020900 RepID=A0AA96JU91_9BACT|nr:glycoside hydrolase family 99-like domain-containing protein [Candidatus Nitrospira allomarina]WNM59880.1 glycoside hydrolase family 99-like domain-containing protein [Candidatus Nitrospira allomarina]